MGSRISKITKRMVPVQSKPELFFFFLMVIIMPYTVHLKFSAIFLTPYNKHENFLISENFPSHVLGAG